MHPDYRHRPTAGLRAFDVRLGDRIIDTVFYGPTDAITADEVYRSLVDHDGYSPAIEIEPLAPADPPLSVYDHVDSKTHNRATGAKY